jgi:hypothetical protein
MIKISLTIIFLFSASLVFSQCDSTQWAAENSYQLIRNEESSESKSISKTLLTSEQLCLIESSRKDHQIVIIDLDAYTRVRIFPRYTDIKLSEE